MPRFPVRWRAKAPFWPVISRRRRPSAAVQTTGPGGISSGLKVWLDADDDASFTYSGGVVVSQWNDLSGNGYHETQGTGGSQPSRSGTLNGRDTVVFDGSADHMVSSALSDVKPVTMFAVVKKTNAGTNRTIWGADSDGGLQWRFEPDETMQILKQSTAGIGISTTPITTTSGVVVAITYTSGGIYTFYVNGVADGTGTNNQTLVSSSTQLARQGSTDNEWLLGELGEFIQYDRVLSGGEITTVNDYLTTKWIATGDGYPVYTKISGVLTQVPVFSKISGVTTEVPVR